MRSTLHFSLTPNRDASEHRLLSSFYRGCLLALVDQCADGNLIRWPVEFVIQDRCDAHLWYAIAEKELNEKSRNSLPARKFAPVVKLEPAGLLFHGPRRSLGPAALPQCSAAAERTLIEKRLQQIADAHNVTDDFALIEPLVVTTNAW